MDAALLDLLARAARSTEAVLARMGPGDDGRVTPCPGMTASQVAGHLVGGMRGFTAVAEGGELRFDADLDPGVADGHPAAVFRLAVDGLLAAFGAPGRVEATYAMPWGATTGFQLLGFELIETVVHGWDIARSLGVAPAFDDDVVEATLGGARQWVDESVRVPGMFGPAVPVHDATPLDELVAFLGRDPTWTP